MTTIDDGGPAFGGDCVSVRDYFAAKCIPVAFEKFRAGLKEYEIFQLFGTRCNIKGQDIIAAVAYELADAMMAHRKHPTRS